MRCDLLFVYGTLLRDRGHPMARVLAHGATVRGSAAMQGRLYRLRGYPGAVTSRIPDEWVIGELYRLKYPNRIFARLDDYEMCSDKFPEPREYRREIVTVAGDGGAAVRAWAYLYNRSTARLRRIASGNFRDASARPVRASHGSAAGE